MSNIFSLTTYILGLSLILFTCSHDHAADGHHAHDHDQETQLGEHEADDHHEPGVIHMSQAQVATMKIEFGTFSSMKINDYIAATGTLGLPPNAVTSVSPKAEGFIQNSKKYVEGSYVKKGAIMAHLENPAFIEQQQTYLEVAAALVFDEQELERQQALLAANAGVERSVQQLSSAIAVKQAKLQGIGKQLAYLGINTSTLTAENIVQRVAIFAPMSGYITSINMHNGMYVTPAQELMEIVNENHLHLELDVFEKDIARIQKDQRISYQVPALGTQFYEGEVHVIGKEFNAANKTVRIHGHLEAARPTFIKDLFLEAKIWLNDQTVQALPEAAIIKDGMNSVIYAMEGVLANDELAFRALRVMPGTTDNGFTTVKLIDPLPTDAKVVTKGAYYVYAQSKVGELEHSH